MNFATTVEEASTIMSRYYINMHTMGFTTHEAKTHYKTMARTFPTAKPREICWLVQNYAQKRSSSPLRMSYADSNKED